MGEDAKEHGRTRLLIVEDDEAQLRTLRAIMEDEGFEVVGCTTSAEALEHLDDGDVDAAVIDLRLPDMGETELMARLAGAAGDVPVIVHTGYASLASAKQAVNSGAFAYIEKGRDPGELVQCAHRAVAIRLKRRAEEALRASEVRYRSLYESMRDAFAAVDMDGRIVECNPAFAELLGYSEAEVRNLTYQDFTPERWHAEEARITEEQVFARGYSDVYEKEYIRKDGTVFPVELRTFLTRDDSGEPRSMWAVVRNITQRKQAEQALRESEERYRALFEGAAEGILVADIETREFLYANPTVCSMLGYSEQELTGMSVADVHPAESLEAVLAAFEAQVRGTERLAPEVPCLRKDGSVVYADINSAPVVVDGRDCNVGFLTDVTVRRQAEEEIQSLARFPSENPYPVLRIAADGTVLYANSPGSDLLRSRGSRVGGQPPSDWEASVSTVLAVGSVERREVQCGEKTYAIRFVPVSDAGYVNLYGTEITEQKRAEEQLRQAQKMDAVGRLAGGIAHDFRNQLTVARWCAQKLLRRSLVNDEGRSEVEEIIKAVDRSAALTGQLLAFSRQEVLRPRAVDLTDVVSDMQGALQRMIGEDISFSILPAEGACHANLDPNQLQQAIVNLVLNARDAMPTGGDLTIRMGCAKLGRRAAQGHGAAAGRYSTVAVADTGVGMDEEARRRAFDPFFTTKDLGQGVGLGLSMVYGFVKQSGGFIEVESRPGKGSTFTLYFPRAAGVPDPVRARQVTGELPRGSGTVLVVEDEAPVRRKLAGALEDAGYTVLDTGSPQKALPLARRHEGPIDMLITDVVMPSMSGVELAKRVRRAFPGIRVLFISGYLGEDLSRRGLDETRQDVLRKPFTEGELLGKVRDAFQAPREEADRRSGP